MECRWHFAVYIALTESRSENHSITHFSLIIFNDHTLTAWYQVYIYISLSWSHSYSVMSAPHILRACLRFLPVRLRYRLALIGAQVTLQPHCRSWQALNCRCKSGWKTKCIIGMFLRFIYIYILHIYNIYQRKSNSKVFHVHNCIGLETCIYIMYLYIYILYHRKSNSKVLHVHNCTEWNAMRI